MTSSGEPSGDFSAVDLAAHVEDAVDRRLGDARHLGEDVGHRLQVLVVDEPLALRLRRR